MHKHNIGFFIPNINLNDCRWLPTVWVYLKTHYDHFGKHPEEFNWVTPRINKENDYGIKEDLLKNPPKVFGFSGYIWNINQCYRISKWVKKQFPDCIVVGGGPQPEYKWDNRYFRKHPYIDIIVPFDGEIPFTDILDTVAEGRTDFENCADLVLPPDRENLFQGWKTSDKSIPRKNFVFPPSALLHCREELERLVQETVADGHEIAAMTEVNRGCPYKCTFCDWGGGIYTKIRRKPMEDVYREIDWLTSQPFKYLTFADANFGVFQTDVDATRYLVELRKETGYPEVVRFSSAKNNKERVLEIFLLLAREGAADNYRHAFQDTDGDVKDIIQRKDISWEQSLEIAREVQAEGFESKIQMILGLPGQSWETFLANIDHIMGEGGLFDWPRFYPFLLLPNAPAADPAYQKQYEMKFIERGMAAEVPRIRTDIPMEDFVSTANFIDGGYDEQRGWYVIETSTYSREDYVHFFTLSHVLYSLQSTEMTRLVADYLEERYGIKHSDFYRGIYEDFLLQEDPETSSIGGFVQHWLAHFTKWAADKTDNSYEESCIPWNDSELPWELNGRMYFQYYLFLHRDEFYQKLTKHLEERFDIPELSSLIEYNKNIIIDFGHSLKDRKVFESKHNWKEYFENGAKLKTRRFRYEVMDKTVTYGLARGTFPIDWQDKDSEAEKRLQFIYRVVWNRTTSGRYLEIVRLGR